VLPVIRNENFLLVTLVTLNSFAASALPIFMDKLVPEASAARQCQPGLGALLPPGPRSPACPALAARPPAGSSSRRGAARAGLGWPGLESGGWCLVPD
jgi:hypothetical protein